MDTINKLWQRLSRLYEVGEAKAIVNYVLEERFGLTRADVYCGKADDLSIQQKAELDTIMARLENAEPVQYVLGYAYFAGRRFVVGPGVLVPRPETEDLCSWILREQSELSSAGNASCNILDIGTGSGCIAITLALGMPEACVSAWDICDDAIDIASKNACMFETDVNIVRQDALEPPEDEHKWNMIVSNPPYIYDKERVDMERNVLEYEPHTALFVPDDDPLLFYRVIARYALHALVPDGMLYFEINPLCAEEMTDMLRKLGYRKIELRKDMFGKDRFMKAVL